ncbi:MAG: substrate-binding domain-containing protein, partial [Melioribacteraceae bacterium]|nr:substrate-binding domain-containing protein [Melioribacteraceae bacterium]
FLIASDALSIYINPDNQLRNLTSDQIAKIFKCEITNWSQLGQENAPIFPISRSSASGTNLYFIKHILKGDQICSSVPIANTTKEVIRYVKNNKHSIGYGGIGYADASMQCSIDGIKPTKENVINNTYPLSRYLRYYTPRMPKGNVKRFIDWVISEKGQKLIESIGYFPLWI